MNFMLLGATVFIPLKTTNFFFCNFSPVLVSY